MRIVGEAKTKLILFGEHAAVYGHPALVTSLPWKIAAELLPTTQPHWTKHGRKLQQLLRALNTIFPQLNGYPPFQVAIHSDAPIGVGLGSSGALCVAMARAIYDYISETPDFEQLWNSAHEMEKVFHHTPSGIDTGTSILDHLCYFEKKNPGLLPSYTLLKTPPLHLIIGAVQRHSDTAALVSNLQKKKEQDRTTANKIDQLGAIAKEAARSLLENNMDHVGELANTAHRHLCSLGLSTDPLNRMISFGLSKGALGGKLSGAGGGGSYFLLAKTAQEAQSIAIEMATFASSSCIKHILCPREAFGVQ